MPTSERITPGFLRAWPLPDPGGSKYSRGQVLVVGGSRRSPGAALLSGRAALRVGAGRLTLAIGESVGVATAVALPECGVVLLPESRDGSVRGFGLRAASPDLARADAVLAGPGLDDAGETAKMLRYLGRVTARAATLVLDAYALGALAGRPGLAGGGRRILTPNTDEAERLLGRRAGDLDTDVLAIARRYRAVVSCFGRIASPDGRLLTIDDQVPGLGTSGSGDVLSGAIAGLAARGCEPLQAAAWGTYLHVAAGMSLSKAVAPVGFLASEIVERLAYEVVEVGRAER
ncbi:NAD(P)H-hydrate dehydratase [Leifsonia sp. McL0607]|uniref:NAD(P)H-hydrate dehydratase n=1 Tax=Leifsonia sp. McL0607 TaxID=3415672 RepID=UPI003CE71514